MGETRTSNGTGKLIAALLSLFFITAGGVVGFVAGSMFGWDIDICYTVGESIVAVAAILALGGASYLRIDRDAIIESWKFMWWIIVISAVLMVWDLVDYVAAGEVIQHGWFLRCLASLVLCLAIGISEEGMFRGLLFGGLLARFGEKKRGILWCVALSSLAFGCAHVTPEDFDFTKWYTIVQALLKICQTGIYAVMLCAVVLKTKSLVGAMVMHALDDYLLFIVSSGLYGESFETEYVTPDVDEAIATIVFYLIIIALYLPTFIKAVRWLMKVQAPQYGPFVKERPLLVDEGAGQFVQPYAPQMMPPAQQPTYYPVPAPVQPLMPNSTMVAHQPYADSQSYQWAGQQAYPAEQAPQQWFGQEPAQPEMQSDARTEPQMYPQWQPQQQYVEPQQAWQQPQYQPQQAWQQPQGQVWPQQVTSRRPPKPEGLA